MTFTAPVTFACRYAGDDCSYCDEGYSRNGNECELDLSNLVDESPTTLAVQPPPPDMDASDQPPPAREVRVCAACFSTVACIAVLAVLCVAHPSQRLSCAFAHFEWSTAVRQRRHLNRTLSA